MKKPFVKLGFTHWQFSIALGSFMVLFWQSSQFPIYTALLGANYAVGLICALEHYQIWKKEREVK